MKRKIFSFVISLSIVLQMFIPAVSAEHEINASINMEAVQLLEALGITDSQEIEAMVNTKISRGEFAVYAGRILGVSENASAPESRYFIDVAQNSRFAPSVTALYESGIVKGTEDKLFEPDVPVKPFDAAVMMLRLGGYENYVKVGADYTKLIAQNGLLDGIQGESLNGAQAAELIFRALLMPYFNILSYGSDLDFSIEEDHSVMYEFYKVYEVDGCIESAEGIAISSVASAENRTVINGTAYESEGVYAYKDLGCFVTGYVMESKDGIDKLISYAVSAKNRITEIDIEKISYISDDGLILKYYQDSLDKIYTVNLPANVNVLKNGKRLTSDIAAAFDESQGSIRIIENPYYGTTVQISVYDSVFVSKNDTDIETIYAKAGESINLASTELVRKRIYLAGGQEGSISDIRNGMLLTVYRSDVSVEIYVCTDTVSGTISAKNEEEVTVNGNKYKVEPALHDELFGKIELGAKYEFYLNKHGEIAYYSDGSSDTPIGFLIEAVSSAGAFSDELIFKMMKADGSIVTLKAKDKMEINGEKKTNDQILESLDATGLSGRAQLVSYVLDANGNISSIYTATNDENGKIELKGGFDTRYHKLATRTLGKDVALKADAVLFKIPDINSITMATDKEFEVMTAMENNTSYYCAAYSLGGESFLSDVIIVSSNDIATDFRGDDHVWMFDSIYQDIDDEGMERTKVILAGVKRDGGLMKIEEFVVPDDFAVTDENRALGDVSWDELTQGDLIWIKHNSKDELLRIRMVFDHDKEGIRASDCYNKPEYIESMGRFIAGYAHSRDGLLVALGINSPADIDEISYMVDGAIAVYDSTARKDKVYVGTVEDILTYDEVGDSASVVVPVSWYAWSRMIFVYKNGI